MIQSWDTAATSAPSSDWSVGMTWGLIDNEWFLIDLIRQRLDYPDLKRAVVAQMHIWKPDRVLIERASTGLSLVAELRREGYTRIIAPGCKGDKQERLIAQTAELASGNFLLPDQAPWLNTLRSELRALP